MQILALVIGMRQRIVETYRSDDVQSHITNDSSAESEETAAIKNAKSHQRGPPAEVISQFEDYRECFHRCCAGSFQNALVIPYVNNEEAHYATKNSLLKLLWRLINFETREQSMLFQSWH